jgi:hypothetical protein
MGGMLKFIGYTGWDTSRILRIQGVGLHWSGKVDIESVVKTL